MFESSQVTIKTTTNLPPHIMMKLNRALLIDLKEMRRTAAQGVYARIAKKYKNNPGILSKCKELLNIHEELYGWFEKEKAYRKAEDKEAQERSPFPHEVLHRVPRILGNSIRLSLLAYANRHG